MRPSNGLWKAKARRRHNEASEPAEAGRLTRVGLIPRWLLLAAIVAVTGTFWLQLCDLVYDCGCRGFWAGAAEHCNIHHEPAGSSHRCPWCVSPLAGGASFVGTMGWFAFSLLRRWPQRFAQLSARSELASRLAVAGLAIPIFVFGIGWMSGAAMGYWG